MELATRYRWQIWLEKRLKNCLKLLGLKKAAPRFELGIKDLQSSALPLGHAALKGIESLSPDRISKENQSVLFLCNGHGEDLIALRILEKLHKISPSLALEVLPLVGKGNVFRIAISQQWLTQGGPSISLPSGGFSNQSLRAFFEDLCSGLFFSTLTQWLYVRKAASKGTSIVAIGDFLPLFFAWTSGAQYAFFGTPKSDYTWVSGPGWNWSDYYHRLKGTEWDPWEYALMKSQRCKLIAVRDKITARGLRSHSVLAQAPRNPMMDGFEQSSLPDSLKSFRRFLLLCGSRMPEAQQNFKRLLHSVDLIRSSSPLLILVTTGSEPTLETLVNQLDDSGYRKSYPPANHLGEASCWIKGSKLLLLGPYQFVNWASWAEIGLANAGTATEQLVGLGIPCVSLPGKGPQFKPGFASRQSRLLAGAVLPSRTPEIFAKRVELLLRDKDFRKTIAAYGAKRMGLPGGSLELSLLIMKTMLNK